MIEAYRETQGRLALDSDGIADLDRLVWIDLISPTADEEQAVETALGIDIPTREDMQEIELSSRLYQDRGALFLTAQIIASQDRAEPELAPVTFVLLPERLVTVRYHNPGSFEFFTHWAERHDMGCVSGHSTMMALMEAIVDRLADLLEGEARKLDALSKAIFEAHRPSGRTATLAVVLQRIGRAEDMNSKLTESLATILRLLGFLSAGAVAPAGHGKTGVSKTGVSKTGLKGRLKTLLRDAQSLAETASVQNRKILFQLDATLGVINIRQADVIKIFSVVAFVFLPPTLIASVYGMNFVHMPELQWPWGYPMALGLMVISAVVPWLIFRAKKWL